MDDVLFHGKINRMIQVFQTNASQKENPQKSLPRFTASLCSRILFAIYNWFSPRPRVQDVAIIT